MRDARPQLQRFTDDIAPALANLGQSHGDPDAERQAIKRLERIGVQVEFEAPENADD